MLRLVAGIVAVGLAHMGFASAGSSEHSKVIVLKPTGQTETASLKRGGVECTFEWNVVGGTDEEWLLQILADKATRTYTCEIERPEQKSYLYFQQFSASLSHLGTAELFDSDRNVLKDGDHFVQEGNKVSNKEGGFSGSLRELKLTTKPAPSKEHKEHKEL